ncbi:MAG: pantetheine-phosphate adenylyltransferase [Myxococcales bacterium]|nr:pantetheine-phosphate adenylyltransferase [Myxococcales bacterium]
MRVIGGTFGGRRLLGPPRGAETRPTSDKVREAVFNVLGDLPDGARALDLFAGTGALGIEALSRGARHVTFVELDSGLCQTIETNLDNLEVEARLFHVHRRDVRRALKKLEGPFDLVFIDPPYGHLLEREALVLLAQPGMLSPGAQIVVEHASREQITLPQSVAGALAVTETRVYGDTSVTFVAPQSAAPSTEKEPQAMPVDAPTHANEAPRIAVYAGSFDPPTNGHFDIIRRGARLFDHLVVAVADNPRKQTLFTAAERMELLRSGLGDEAHKIEIDRIEGLLVDYAVKRGAVAIIRGLRAVADFEYEFQMKCMNHHLAPAVDTVFLMTAQEYFYVSSSLVKEVAGFGGDVSPFLPPGVRARLLERLAERKKSGAR